MSTTNDKVRSPPLLLLLLLLLLPPALPVVVVARGPRPSRDARADAPAGRLRGPHARGAGADRSGDDEENDDGGGVVAAAPPKLADCLLSAASSDDCGSVVPGCVWCAEPIYGLCVTESAASKMRMMPFFECGAEERLVSGERVKERGGWYRGVIRLVNVGIRSEAGESEVGG
jgi:hypothetical protein